MNNIIPSVENAGGFLFPEKVDITEWCVTIWRISDCNRLTKEKRKMKKKIILAVALVTFISLVFSGD